jgi:hypothetical protein
MGDIESWMDESWLLGLFSQTGELTNVKIMRNKTANNTPGYAFLYFTTPAAATRILESCNNQPIPGLPTKVFRLNWATFSGKQ